ncbi:MAG: YdcF family protein [Candidatus Binatia bacterium]
MARSEADVSPSAGVAVVLGAAVRAGGRPTGAWRGARHAIALVRAGAVDHLLLTGGIGRHPPAEARVMRELAVAAGLDPGRLVLEETATSTLESARACARLIAERGWSRVVLVSDAYHLPRARLAFRRFGIDAEGSAPPGGRGDTPAWQWRLLRLRELVAIPWYWLRLSIGR